MKKINTLFVLFFLICNLSFNIDNCICQWKQTSGPEGGAINALGTNGSSTIFAAAGNNGIFRSLDNGAHWAASGLNNLTIGGFIFKGNYVFAIDQNAGLWRSKDNGNSWTNLNFSDYIISFTVKGNNIFVGTYSGVMRSSDNGNSWVLANNGISSTIYSMTSNSNYLFAGGYEMIFRSADNGNNWIQYNLPSGVIANSMIANGSTIFIGSAAGVYRSANNGVNWALSGLDSLGISSFAKSGNSIFANTSVNFVGYIVRTDNNGVNWKVVNSDIISTDISALTANNQYIFAGFYLMGISRSATKGDDWVVSNTGLTAVDINYIISMDNDLYACNESGGGIFYSANNGAKWTDYNIGLQDLNVHTFAVNANSSTIYAGTDNGIYYTSPHNNIWMPMNNGLSNLYTSSIAVNGKKLYANSGGKRLYISTDGGLNWDTSGLRVYSWTGIYKIALGSNMIYASLTWHHHSVTNSWLVASTDGGITWNDISSSQVESEVISEVISKGSDVYLGVTGETYHADTSTFGVYRSTDKGANWTLVKDGMNDHNVTSLCFSNSDLIAGTSSGNIYRSTNKGDNWILLSPASFSGRAVNTLTVNNKNIFAGINNNSVWKYPLPKSISLEPVSEFKGNNELLQNYPNPFNPVTKIKFDIAPLLRGVGEARGVFTSLKVFDITGREIKTLVNEKLNPGTYEVTFDGSNLSSGVYFYKIRAGEYSETKRMILTK